MAVKLEQRIAADSKRFKDLERFAQYPPFVDAIRLAKEKKINKPFIVPNTNYWYFETDLQDWIRHEGTGMLSGFLLAIKGFPYEEMKEDEQQTGKSSASRSPNSPADASSSDKGSA
jgi:hypothetical protein